ncbi:MAG: alpha/beta fold hydrolase, partial [Pseudomonadota bacterium]
MAAGRSAAALFLIALLGACSVGGGLPQPVEAPGPGEITVAGAGGAPLAASRWQAAEPRAVILALHGYGDHAESTFSDPAAFWAERGISTVAYDQRGFGRNPSRGVWPGAERLRQDLLAVARELRRAKPCLPLIVLGHSMGGGVALAAGPKLAADGLILAAPAI